MLVTGKQADARTVRWSGGSYYNPMPKWLVCFNALLHFVILAIIVARFRILILSYLFSHMYRYLVRTLDTGESVRLQYRSLQKVGGQTPSNDSEYRPS